MAGSRLVPVRVGGVETEVEAVVPSGTEATAGRVSKAAGEVADAFSRAEDAIIAVARSARSESVNFFGAINVEVDTELAKLDHTGYRPLRQAAADGGAR